MKDVERVAAFYADVIGLPIQARHLHPDGSLRSVWLATSPGSFIAIEPGEPRQAIVVLRISRADRAAWVAELGRRSVAIEKQSRFTLYVKDPEGNTVGLSHHPEDAGI